MVLWESIGCELMQPDDGLRRRHDQPTAIIMRCRLGLEDFAISDAERDEDLS